MSMKRTYMPVIAGLLLAMAPGCDTKDTGAPGVTEEETAPRGGGVSPGLGSGTDSSGSPEWMQDEQQDQREQGEP
jgi:hypothetical protein